MLNRLSYMPFCYSKNLVTARFNLILALICLPLAGFCQKFSKTEVQRFKAEAARVTIIRDNYGVPHIYGKTDADAVFGLMYAQCEDNFKGIERSYLYQF